MATMPDRRDLPHRIYGKVGLALQPVVGNDLGFIGLADFLKHPADNPSARLRVGVEGEVSHFASPNLNSRSADYACLSACSSAQPRSPFCGGFDVRAGAGAPLRSEA